MNVYGQFQRDEKYPLEALIWGHRLRDNQHWIEYLLEFLSVLVGYDYSFGRGTQPHQKYRIPKRLGLRRFIFYDKYEKTQDSRDDRAVKMLREALVNKVEQNKYDAEATLQQIQVLLRSFAVIEDNRSWYAKSLFPAHENLLLWEALRKRSTKDTYRGPVDHFSADDLDESIEFNARNFFARGGELYYLIISAGTEHDSERRERIARSLWRLLTEQNQSLGELASLIDQTWQEQKQSPDNDAQGSPGWIPDPDCKLYQQFAEDLDILLDNSLDALESLELLAHLICFHVILYIYHRAHPQHDPSLCQTGKCLDVCRPELLIDIPGDEESQKVRSLSANQLRLHEQWQVERVRRYIKAKVEAIAKQTPPDQFLDQIRAEVDRYLGGIRRKGREQFEKNMQSFEPKVLAGYTAHMLDQVVESLDEVMGRNFRDHFVSVHRRLGRSIGLIAPLRGPQPRFVLGDNLLKTLTMTVIPAGKTMTFGQFLETLYARYGIIIGPGEARKAQFFKRSRTNEGVFARNRDRFLLRMKLAGLLTQYSDATAMVHRP
ncbi:hypothetical protein [Chloroflexus sp.]|uniref:hypothetical protein n=1 Tax=Chloroflexus sp. TaxID=1904827 RepID=UPI002618FF4F|nr:hypothetical protein [uncultured Chloroflexus sp.]